MEKHGKYREKNENFNKELKYKIKVIEMKNY